MSRFYLTTPIYYINAEPHLGHAYTTMVADAVARAHRLAGDDVFFLTGTDEHGQKVERAAQRAGLSTGAFADRVSQKFRDLLPTLNVTNDDFIRTTEPRHHAASQALWRLVRDRGFIYKDKYEGWYCTVDEIFVPDTQLQDGRCPICGNAVETNRRGELFFPALGVSAAPPRPLPEQPGVPGSGGSSERDAVLPAGRARGSQCQPDLVPMGHSGA